jgi:Fe2+ or Zn2+ uptake regulation protein
MRMTQTRKKILNLLENSSHPLTADQLLSQINVNKTTIYRQLESLTKSGLLQAVNFGGRKIRYELTSLGHHHHLVCNHCESVTDIVLSEDLNKLASASPTAKNFRITSHYLEFFGLCNRCQSL